LILELRNGVYQEELVIQRRGGVWTKNSGGIRCPQRFRQFPVQEIFALGDTDAPGPLARHSYQPRADEHPTKLFLLMPEDERITAWRSGCGGHRDEARR